MQQFLIVGISQGLILSTILIYKSLGKRNNAWLMGVFVLLITGIIAGSPLNAWLGEPVGSFLVDPLILLVGPSFYLYILSFSRTLTKRDFLRHGLAFLVYIPLLASLYYQSMPANPTRPSLQEVYASTFALTLSTLKFFHLFFYVYLSFGALGRHRRKMQRVFADLTGKDLAWLRYMLGAFVFLSIVTLLLYVLALRYPVYQDALSFLNLALLCIFILTISFYAFHQNTIFDYANSSTEAEELREVVAETEGPRYEKSGLKPEEAREIQEKIQSFIAAGGYREPGVTLGSMAEEIRTPPHKISEVLSRHLHTNFYDLINSHRVEDIRQAIHDPRRAHLTILAIAYEFGYNSKSTFNAAFKKFTGMTPSAYKIANARESVA